MKAVLGEDREVCRLTLGEVAQIAALGIRGGASLIVPILQRVVKIDATRKRGHVAGERIVVTQARLRAFVPDFTQLDGVGIGSRAAWQDAFAAAPLALAEAREVSAECLDIQFPVL